MKKTILFFLVLLSLPAPVFARPKDPDIQFLDQTIIMGTIQFPYTMDEVPPIRIYYAGNKIRGEADHDLKKSTFVLPTDRHCKTYYLLICEHVIPHTQENLVQYLKVRSQSPYKLFVLQLVDKPAKDPKKPYIREQEWKITKAVLGKESRIPDYAIIICYNPDFIEGLESKSAYQLPIIKIRPDVLTIAGSEDALQQFSIQLLLGSLDNDLIHATIKPDLKTHYQNTVVAMMTP